MRCPICGEEIDVFYCDVIFKQTVTSYRVMEDGVEVIDEDEQETEEERCFCPHCDAEFEMGMNDAEALLKGEAILVDKNTPMKIIEVYTEAGWREKLAVIKVNDELFFSDPERYKVIIHHNKIKEMLLFVKHYPIKIKLPDNLTDLLNNIEVE